MTTDTVVRAVKFRIDPKALSKEQSDLMDRCAGASRTFWNWGLDIWNQQERAVNDVFAERIKDLSDEEKEAARKDKSLWKEIRESTLILEVDGKMVRVDAFSLDKAHSRQAADPEHYLHWYKAEKHGIPSRVVKESIRNLGESVTRYMKGQVNKGKSSKPRKDGRPDGWPRFKSRYDDKAFVRPALNFDMPKKKTLIESSSRIYIPSIGSLRVGGGTKRLKNLINVGGIAKTARFTCKGGYWYVSISVTVPAQNDKMPTQDDMNRLKNNGVVGIDLGVKTLATLSNGSIVENPRHGRKNKARVDGLRRKVSVATKGSENRKKAVKHLSKVSHRNDLRKKTFLHGVTKDWTTTYESICIEDLNVSGMTSKVSPKIDPNDPTKYLPNGASAKSGLNREILDIGFYELRRQLEYKSLLYGSNVQVIDRFFPSSKTCSKCGQIKSDLKLSDREYVCDCGLTIDRDLNAAINIKKYFYPELTH